MFTLVRFWQLIRCQRVNRVNDWPHSDIYKIDGFLLRIYLIVNNNSNHLRCHYSSQRPGRVGDSHQQSCVVWWQVHVVDVKSGIWHAPYGYNEYVQGNGHRLVFQVTKRYHTNGASPHGYRVPDFSGHCQCSKFSLVQKVGHVGHRNL